MKQPFQNEFSWSYSRLKAFRDCLRRYYWQYYGSWGGWEQEAEPEARLAYQLKQIVNMPMWAGDLVHRGVEHALRRARSMRLISPDELKTWLRRRMNDEWFQSANQSWRQNAKHNRNLFEHFYGLEITKEAREDFRTKVFRCVDHFFASTALEEALSLGAQRWRSLETLAQYYLEDIKNFVVIDFAYDREDGGPLVLVDWKTGKLCDEDTGQLANYALFAFHEWRVPPDQVQLALAYLDTGEHLEWRAKPEDLIAMRETIYQSAAAMRERLDDPQRNIASMDHFPMTEQVFKCRTCNYQRLCHGKTGPPPSANNGEHKEDNDEASD
ncbi:PD-(D/E)XK nuclease family protein [Candidatus Sumerlaeota bacterium]|nr:PD-(D/E)XK nuclease family protein [Candidatus Sumerlaeota bacterium]